MGRGRRSDSTSSVETVDISHTRWCQEASVVKAAPSTEDLLDHIQFEVKDVTIFGNPAKDSDQSTGEPLSQYANVLEVRIHGPFAARGTLIVEDAEQRDRIMIRKPKPKAIPIEIRTVHRVSIGETEELRPAIWMLGRSGAWYEVVPSKEYKPTYDEMAEAVFFWYRIVDFYSKPEDRIKVPGKRDEISRLFLQYASTVGDGSTFEDVAERCEKHALFLFYQFETEKDFVASPDESSGTRTSWHTTEIYKWLKRRRNHALTAVQVAFKNPPSLARETPVRLPATAGKAHSPTIRAPLESKRERSTPVRAVVDLTGASVEDGTSPPTVPRSAKGTPVRPSTSTDTDDELPDLVPSNIVPPTTALPQNRGIGHGAAVTALMEAIKAMSVLKGGPLSKISATSMLFQKYKVPAVKTFANYKQGVIEIIHFYSQELIQEPAFEDLRGSEFYRWVHELAAEPFEFKCLSPAKFPFIIVPRAHKKRSAEEEHEPERRAHPTVGGKRLPRDRPKKSYLSVSHKRTYDEFGGSDGESENKRSNYFSDGDETMDDSGLPQDPSNSAGVADEPITVSYGEPVDFVVRTEALPSWATRRQDGAWVCNRNGCDYVVRGEVESVARERIERHIADHDPLTCSAEGCDFVVNEDDDEVAQLRMRQHKLALHGPWKCEREDCTESFWAQQGDGPEQQRLVQEHIASHERRDQKLNLAVSESRPHLPIDHLLEKIRALGRRQDEARAAAAAAGVPESGDAQRIKRKLVV